MASRPSNAPAVPPCRRFGVSDALVMVGATAAALAITRDDWPDLLKSFFPGVEGYSEDWAYFAYRLAYLVYWFSYFPASWTLALLVLRLRGPRPGLRRLTLQPGVVASAAAVVVLFLRAGNLGIMYAVFAVVMPGLSVHDLLTKANESAVIPSELGCAVAAAWAVQKLGGRWHAEPSWLDRTGRGLGFYWIGTIPFSWFSMNI